MTRQTKTPAQRAQEAVDVLQRRLTKLRGKARAAREESETHDREARETQARLDYALQNPDLPTQPEQYTAVTEEQA